MSRRATRGRLLSLLSEACELEHALACSYLFAAFTIKRELAEGITWRQQQRNRRWASEIYHIAAQEMLHLGQAWNLLAAVGGTPYFARPNFPLAARHYPLSVALVLRRFDVATLDRFLYYETPAHSTGNAAVPMPADSAWPIDESFPYTSVGELYAEVIHVITSLGEASLFIADPGRQVGADIIDFADIIAVTDRASAVAAIERITSQGEGTVLDREDSHYGVFRRIQAELRNGEGDGDDDDPALPVGDNPFVRRRRDQIPFAEEATESTIVTTEITDVLSIASLDLFDDTYVSMLQALGYVFGHAVPDAELTPRIAQASLELMTTVLKSLGEAICRLPSGQPELNAGPTFALSRHTHLPPEPAVAAAVFGERLAELAQHGELLIAASADAPAPVRSQIRGAAKNLERLAAQFAAD